MRRVFTATWRENLDTALDKGSRIYDKRKVSGSPAFPGKIYVYAGSFSTHPELPSLLYQAVLFEMMFRHRAAVILSGQVPDEQVKPGDNQNPDFTVGPAFEVDTILSLESDGTIRDIAQALIGYPSRELPLTPSA